jgi:hypothetical protein
MAVKLVECFDWKVEDRPGELLRAAEALAKAGVNLDALWAYTSQQSEPKIAAIGKNPAKLEAALKKGGVRPSVTRCFWVSGTDKAGALVKTFRALAEANINVECFDALAVGGKYAATFWVSGADLPKAKQILKVR